MKTLLKGALTALILGAPAIHGFSLDVKVATASCKQKMNQDQTVSCGNINAPLTINTTGGGNVYFGPTTCYIQAGQSASQQAMCSAQAA